jgi:hypothetical protein
MKAITQANATAQTARGWEKNEPDSVGASGDWRTDVDTDFLPGRVEIATLYRKPIGVTVIRATR